MKKNSKSVYVAVLGLALFACGSPETEVVETNSDSLAVDTTAKKVDEEKEFKLHMIMANIPSPSHEIVVINKAGYSYQSSLILDKSKAGSYTSEFKRGVSYGIYSADLAYASSFKNNKDILPIFGATNKAAESAGLGKVFQDITKSANFESMQSNSDSLEAILERAYLASENYLESDHHMDIAARVMMGAMIEGQYVLLSTLDMQKSAKENDLKAKVWESKLHLMNLIELLKEYSNDTDLAPIAASITEYYKNYDGASGIENFSKDKLTKMLKELTAIRTKLVE